MTIALVGTVQTSQGTPSTHAAITGIANGDLYVDLAHDTGGGTAPALDATSTFTTLGNGTDSGGRTWLYGYRIRTGTEGTLSATGGAALTNIFFGLTGISGVESFASTNNTSTIPASTPTADNCWHIIVSVYTSAGGNIIATPPSGYTLLGSVAVAGQGTIYAYYKDLGAGSSGVSTGTVAVTWTTGSGDLAAGFIVKPAASGPTVTSTSSASNTEGSAIVHTVTLSGATSGSTNYAATLVGVNATGGGTDFTSDLASATYSNGVTFSGGNMVVPDAVSSWTVTIATATDTLDEANETYTLTVGGVSGTGTITDDDAAPTVTGTASSTVTAGDPVVITYSPGLSGQTRTYTLALTDGTATGGTDYDNTTVTGDFAVTAGTGSVSISGSTVTVDAGVTEFTLTITTTA